jgi:hypothetical protein
MFEKIAIETGCYLVFGGLVTLLIFVAAFLALLVLLPIIGPDRWAWAIPRLALFLGILFVCGTIGNAAFAMYVMDHYYVPGDPTVEWLPYFPSHNVDPGFGGHYIADATSETLTMVWASIAAPTWLLAALVYVAIARRLEMPAYPARRLTSHWS